MAVRIFIVDDHELLLDSLAKVLTKENGYDLVTFHSPIRCLQSLESKPDLIISDLQMEEMSGDVFIQKVKETMPSIPILVMSMFAEPTMVRKLQTFGIKGYIQKKFGAIDFKNAIHELLKGNTYFDPEIELILNSFEVKNIQLSVREINIIQLLVNEKSTKEIAENLGLSEHTIKSYRKTIMNKLGVTKSIGIARMAIELNLL